MYLGGEEDEAEDDHEDEHPHHRSLLDLYADGSSHYDEHLDEAQMSLDEFHAHSRSLLWLGGCAQVERS